MKTSFQTNQCCVGLELPSSRCTVEAETQYAQACILALCVCVCGGGGGGGGVHLTWGWDSFEQHGTPVPLRSELVAHGHEL